MDMLSFNRQTNKNLELFCGWIYFNLAMQKKKRRNLSLKSRAINHNCASLYMYMCIYKINLKQKLSIYRSKPTNCFKWLSRGDHDFTSIKGDKSTTVLFTNFFSKLYSDTIFQRKYFLTKSYQIVFPPLTWCFFSFNLQRLCGVVYLKVEWWYNQINILKHWYRFINKLDFQHLVKLFYLLESKLWDNATINCGLGMRGGGWNYPQQLDKSNYMGWWNGMTISVKWVIV